MNARPGSLVCACALLTLLGCTSQSAGEKTMAPASKAEAAAPAAPAARAAIGDFGIDLTAGNPAVKPGDDFFAFANGRWYDSYVIPPDRTSSSAFVELDELTKTRVRQIIETAAGSQPPSGSPAQKIGDYYASFIDQDAIDAHGMAPAAAELRRITAARTRSDIASLFGQPGYSSLFALDLPPDFKDPTRYEVLISQSGLGLPDRDYYLKSDPALQTIREKYTQYIEKMLTLGEVPDAHKRAAEIMHFETEVAQHSWPIEKRRDLQLIYNPRSKQQVHAYAPGFDWQAFLDAAEIGSREQLVLGELTAVRDLAALFARTPLPVLKAYLTFHYLSDQAPYLPRRFDEARFDFYGRTLRGQPQMRERWKRAVDAVNGALGEQLGQLYVEQYFPPQSKAMMQELVRNLLASLGERIDGLDWMSAPTKQRAHEKLATFMPKIGYPDHWKDYSGLEIRREDLLGNVRRAGLWQWRYQVARLDKPVDRSEWQMTPQEINAYYNPLFNEIVFPAAILQPPFFDPNADAAVNYGAIGAIIGHEIGHGFDDQGSKFGANGSMQDWWTPQDAAAFRTRVTRLIAQFNGFEALPGLKVNGANTIGENIGDLGGLNMAYHAYQLSLHGKPAAVIDGLTGDQRFFLAYAQAWKSKYREGVLREQVLSDVHSPSVFRVNGPLPNIDAWYQAFDVGTDNKLYIAPQERVSIW
jgi:putative endopeptidase